MPYSAVVVVVVIVIVAVVVVIMFIIMITIIITIMIMIIIMMQSLNEVTRRMLNSDSRVYGAIFVLCAPAILQKAE